MITIASSRKEAEIAREALGQYVGKTDPTAVKGAISDLQDRVINGQVAQASAISS